MPKISAALEIEFSLSMASRISAPPLPIKGFPLYSIQALQETVCFLFANNLSKTIRDKVYKANDMYLKT
jgi:hypothetical protein